MPLQIGKSIQELFVSHDECSHIRKRFIRQLFPPLPSLDIFWLKDESLEYTENLPAPDVPAAEIVENLESAMEQFNNIIDEQRVQGLIADTLASVDSAEVK